MQFISQSLSAILLSIYFTFSKISGTDRSRIYPFYFKSIFATTFLVILLLDSCGSCVKVKLERLN